MVSRDDELLQVDTKRNAYKIGLVDFPLERFDMFIPDNRTIVADAIAVARALGRRPLDAAEYRRLIGLKG